MNAQVVDTCNALNQSGVHMPGYCITTMRANTVVTPSWVHFGGGNIFMAYLAALQQALLS